jgi:hypothetical protein
MHNVSTFNQSTRKPIQQFILFMSIVTFLSACQKEEMAITPSDSVELKTTDATRYGQVRNAIATRAESEKYCNTDYFYTDSVIINGAAWQYPNSGYEYLMYKGLTHFADASNNYFFCGLEWPSDAYQYGIGFGTRPGGPGYFAFTANVQVCIPEKNYTINYDNAACFAIGDQSLTQTTSIKIILRKKQSKDLVVVPDSVITFAQLKDKLGLGMMAPDSVALYSSIGKVAAFHGARVYNWIYYSSGTSDVYGLENAGQFTQNLNFGDGLAGSCSGGMDIYLHKNNMIYKCSTSYSIFYNNYTGSRKQFHIYE